VKVVALAGGTGAAKLVRGLRRLLAPEDFTIIVNTGDDTEVWGLHVSPDLDTICYALAGLLDEARGWGLRDETFHALTRMGDYGEPTWFNLGDRDLATHLHRTGLLRQGRTLTQVTRAITASLGVAETVLPMSDQPVRTRLLGPDGWLSFQEYFVREKTQVEVRAVEYAGAATALPAPGVLEALRDAGAIVVCPSNPITSMGPILAVPGIADILRSAAAVTMAVSPIVGGQAVSGPAGRLMAACGLAVCAEGVATAYGSWLDILIVDRSDAAEAPAVRGLGIRPHIAHTLMRSREEEVALAREVVALVAHP
jgi:LPPG:FO 2-phospho-L-lactate transferase